VVHNKLLGELGETMAACFLQAKGYRLLARNYRFARREIDLLFKAGRCLVAVEVKLRRGESFGAAVEAVNRRKLERVRLALQGALAETYPDYDARVDLVVIDFSRDMREMKLEHIEGIF